MAKKPVKHVSKLTTTRLAAAGRSSSKDQLVVPREGDWAVRSRGASKAARVFKTQDEAIKQAKKTAARHHASIFVFGEDGRVRAHETSTASVKV